MPTGGHVLAHGRREGVEWRGLWAQVSPLFLHSMLTLDWRSIYQPLGIGGDSV